MCFRRCAEGLRGKGRSKRWGWLGFRISNSVYERLCNSHTHEFDDYIDFEACGATEHPVKTADGSITYIKGFGTVQVNVATSTGLQTIRLRKIAYLPSYKVKLLSHIQLLKEGCSFVDTRKGAYIQLENGTQIPLFKEHGLNKLIGAIDRQVFRDSLNPENSNIWREQWLQRVLALD